MTALAQGYAVCGALTVLLSVLASALARRADPRAWRDRWPESVRDWPASDVLAVVGLVAFVAWPLVAWQTVEAVRAVWHGEEA